MSNLITLDNVSLAYGMDYLLNNAKFQISRGERVCLIGRNGAGKSSLLKIVEGSLMPDSGTVWRQPNIRLARLAQELPQNISSTVYEFVAEGLEGIGDLLADYHALTHRMMTSCTDNDLSDLEKLQHQIDAKNGWQFEQNIKTILLRLDLDPDKLISELSGGWQRRAALAKALVSSPDLLLLDEPTNHLDISAIQWMEDQLISCGVGLLFITHDRSLLRRLATRIIELDRGQLTSWPGDYEKYLLHKDEMLHAEAKNNSDFDKKLAQEEVWIRQGIKARRTRNEGRVRALEAMRAARAKRREVTGKATFSINEAEKSGQLIIEAKNISHQFGDQFVIKDFSTRIMRGDKIGLIGPNGIGKTTLLNILLGNMTPQGGQVILGTKLQVAYFDQLRQALDPEKTVIDNVAEGRESIEIGGKKQHIMSYLTDFLFTPQRALTPVKALSGGECNRLLLARLFTQPANLLVMDEPTNDLDMETLDLLEELLSNYQGTLLLVSHDRTFLDNVVTSSFVFEGNGKIEEYIGGYSDWLRQRKVPEVSAAAEMKTSRDIADDKNKTIKKLSYKDQKELTEMPKKIEKMEAHKQDLHDLIASPEFYKQAPDVIAEKMALLKTMEADLEVAYQRWNELETLSQSFIR